MLPHAADVALAIIKKYDARYKTKFDTDIAYAYATCGLDALSKNDLLSIDELAEILLKDKMQAPGLSDLLLETQERWKFVAEIILDACKRDNIERHKNWFNAVEKGAGNA